MTEAERITATRILREQITARTQQNKLIRNRFGARITIALSAECEFRDSEIAAMEATITEIAA